MNNKTILRSLIEAKYSFMKDLSNPDIPHFLCNYIHDALVRYVGVDYLLLVANIDNIVNKIAKNYS